MRRLAAQRGFTLTALVTLALGIGANVAMFGIVYGLLLRPLPYPDPERLVRVGESSGGRGGVSSLTNRSLPLLEGAESFEHLAAYQASSLEWAGPEGGVTLRGARVSPALFPLLRTTPHLGRLFTDEEAREGADGVVLLSHRAWTNRFGSDPDVVGTVIVGVVADVRYGGLTITESSAEAYVPLPQQERVMALGGLFTGSMVSVRTAGDPLAVIPFLREAATAASPRASIGEVMTMGARLSAAVEQPRFYAVFVGFFAVLALFLAAFGIYALLSYTVSHRAARSGSAWPSARNAATSSPSSSGRGRGSSQPG